MAIGGNVAAVLSDPLALARSTPAGTPRGDRSGGAGGGPARRRPARALRYLPPSLSRLVIGLGIGLTTLVAGTGSAWLGAASTVLGASHAVVADAALVAEVAPAGSPSAAAATASARRLRYPPTVERWRDLAERIGAEEAVAPALLLCVISRESAGRPAAVSRAGAVGLMQLMPDTLQQVLPGGDPLSPEDSVRAGARYLRRSLAVHRNLFWALAGYNAGIEATAELRQTVGYVPEWWKGGEPFTYMHDVHACSVSHSVHAD